MVFIHGYALDSRMWDDQMAAVAAAGFTAVRYDLRGYGRSDPPERGVAFSHADDLRVLLDHLVIDDAVVVGLSLGGQYAVDFALLYPWRCRSLVLVDAQLAVTDVDPIEGFDDVLHLARQGDAAAAKARWLSLPLFAPERRSPSLAARLHEMVVDFRGFDAGTPSLWGDSPRPPSPSRLADVRPPTLVVVGDRDIARFQQIAARLAEQIPDAELERLPGAGHLPNMSHPASFNRTLIVFLQKLRGQTMLHEANDSPPS